MVVAFENQAKTRNVPQTFFGLSCVSLGAKELGIQSSYQNDAVTM